MDMKNSRLPDVYACFEGLKSSVNLRLVFLFVFVAAFFAGAAPDASWADMTIPNTIANTLFPVAGPSHAEEKMSSLVFGLFIGAMAAAALYLFFIWVVIRDRGQVFLMLFLVCLGVNMASGNSILMDAIGPHSEKMRQLLQSYSIILAYVFSIFFTYYFLDIAAHAPHLRMPLIALGGLMSVMLLFTGLDRGLVYFALPTLGTMVIAVVLLTGAATLRRGVSGSFTHLIAFFFFLAGGVTRPLLDIGLVETEEQGNQLTYTAYSMAAMMFAIVIAGQFAKRQEEKERELETSNERFSLAVKGSNEGLFDWNLKTGSVYFSDQLKRILGFGMSSEPDSMKLWWQAIYKPDRRVVRQAWRKFRHNHQAASINVEYRVVHPDEKIHWMHTKGVATRDYRTGKLLRFVGSVGDVTARKQGEVALRASEMRFRSITEAHPVPVLIVRLDNEKVTYASPGAEVLLGLPNGTLTSHSFDRFLTKQADRQELVALMRNGQDVNLKEVTLIRGDGNPLVVALSARRINYQNELAMVIGLYDLTETKKAEQKIAKQQEALQQSEKMAALGGLLAGVAHELNNPLSVIVGQATLLIEGAVEPKVTARGEKIFKAADRCSRIVKSFLALARRKPPERKPVDLNAIIHSSLELLSYQFRNENVALTLDLDPKLSLVSGDSDQLTQVFTNLELNAAQAMLEWAGEKKIVIKTKSYGLGEVQVILADSGPGIPADIKSRVFEPFFTTKSMKGGTGVGLSLCLNIIEAHGGHLMLEETEGGGATFVITLPILMLGGKENVPPDVVLKQGVSQKNLSILIVDDEVELAQTLGDLLEPDGHVIDIAANGAVALKKMREKTYDVIISDLRMPVLDGPGMYAEMGYSMPELQKKIIFVTGDTLSTHIQSFLVQNTVPVIEKPYRLNDVKQAIVKLLKDTEDKGNISVTDSPFVAS